jgi:hypothetical protein
MQSIESFNNYMNYDSSKNIETFTCKNKNFDYTQYEDKENQFKNKFMQKKTSHGYRDSEFDNYASFLGNMKKHTALNFKKEMK